MKREIKFKRVFKNDKGQIEMRLWGNLDHKDSPVDDFSCFKSPASISGYYPITDLQFTGEFDNNHKEICEGDIISNIHVNFEVYWDIGLCAFRARRDTSIKFLYELPISEKYWVSGNIYENPELL